MDWTAQFENGLFDESEAEHITITSDLDEQPVDSNAPRLTNRYFSQSDKTGNTTRNFTIFDEQFLAVSVEQVRAPRQQFSFNLAFLDPRPGRFAGVAWRWLFAALVFTAAAVLTTNLGWQPDSALLGQPVLPGVLLGLAALIAFAAFTHRTRRRLTFYTRHGRAPLLVVEPRLPDHATVDDFVQELKQRIKTSHDRYGQDQARLLRDELREHHRLHEEGVLPDKAYEAGKKRILAAHG